jgi:hypothetical protein
LRKKAGAGQLKANQQDQDSHKRMSDNGF